MKLFIRIKDGQPIEHPIQEDNFRQAFPDIDIDNLPPEFADFVRVEQPTLGVYEIYEGVTYGWDRGVVKDIHAIRTMTEEEKSQKQNKVKQHWSIAGFASWTFDENKCAFVPPVAYPQDGKNYMWSEDELKWVEVILPPQ